MDSVQVRAARQAYRHFRPPNKAGGQRGGFRLLFLLSGIAIAGGDGDFAFAGIDLRLYDQFVDYHMPMMYLSGSKFHDLVKYNISSLRKSVMPLITTNWTTQDGWSNPRELRMNLHAIALNGGKGAGLYEGIDIDGHYLKSIEKFQQELKAMEDFILKGKPCDGRVELKSVDGNGKWIEADGKTISVPKSNPDLIRFRAFDNNGETLVAIMNYDKYHDTTVNLSIKDLPAGQFTLSELMGNIAYVHGADTIAWEGSALAAGAGVTVPKEDVKFFVVRRMSEGWKFAGQAPAPLVDATKPVGEVDRGMSGNSMRIGWASPYNDGNYQVFAETPAQTVWINLRDEGKIEKWQPKGGGHNLAAGAKEFPARHGGLCKDGFWLPALRQSIVNGMSRKGRYWMIACP